MDDIREESFDAFISYSTTDRTWIEKLVFALESRGADTWVDYTKIRPRQIIPDRINDGLKKSRFIVFVMTPDSMESIWTKRETAYVQMAAQEGRLIPLLLNECEIPPLLAPILYLDFRHPDDFEIRVSELLTALEIPEKKHYFIKAQMEKGTIKIKKGSEETLARELATATFLKRKDDLFTFVHKSFREYFHSFYIHKILTKNETPDFGILKTQRLDQKTIYFLTCLDTGGKIKIIMQELLTQAYTEQVSENTLNILYWYTRIKAGMETVISDMAVLQQRMEENIPYGIQMAKAKLSGIVLEGAILKGADFHESVLENANFNHARIEKTTLKNTRCRSASFIEADFLDSILDDADFTEIDASKARFDTVSFNVSLLESTNFSDTRFISLRNVSIPIMALLNYIEKTRTKAKEKKLIPLCQWLNLGTITSSVFDKTKTLLFAGNSNGSIHIFETKTLNRIKVLAGHIGGVNSLVIDQNNTLYSGSSDNTIRVWYLQIGKTLRILKGHEGGITSLALSPDNKTLYSGSYDNTIIAWDLETYERKATFVRMDEGMWLCYLPDGRFNCHPKAIRYLVYQDPETGEIFNAEDLADRFYKPDEVAKVLSGNG